MADTPSENTAGEVTEPVTEPVAESTLAVESLSIDENATVEKPQEVSETKPQQPIAHVDGTARKGPVLSKTPQIKLPEEPRSAAGAVTSTVLAAATAATAAKAANIASSSSSTAGAGAGNATASNPAVAAAVASERLRTNEYKQQFLRAQEKILELEAEMADFSSHLMDEANNKVADANREAAAVAKRNATLQRQIEERDILVDNQQQQLEVLKAMIASGDDRSEQEANSKSSSGDVLRAVDVTKSAELAEALDFARWTSPLRPVARQDTMEFAEFTAFVRQSIQDREERESEAAAAATASPSTWTSAFSVGHQSPSPAPEGHNGSHTTSGTRGSSWRIGRRQTPLSSHKFASRTITEEVEPTLRLDQAAHLSWLTRRAWLASVLDGSLAIEPVGSAERRWIHRPSYPCVLCGESREDPQYGRSHIVRVPRDTQSYAIGNECVMRLRFACDFLAFLRTLHEGLRRLDTPESLTAIWNECLRLREQMFWARTGGFYALADPTARTAGFTKAAEAGAIPSTPKMGSDVYSGPTTPAAPTAARHEDSSSNSTPAVSAPSSPALSAQE